MRTSNSQQLCQRPPSRHTRAMLPCERMNSAPEATNARTAVRVAGIALTLMLTACTMGGVRSPYPRSRLIEAVSWDFSTIESHRKALGSDLWPCAWAADGNLYCAWGDGGGF